MGKRKKDPSTIGLASPQVEGQGTTTTETGSRTESSSRRKQRRIKKQAQAVTYVCAALISY